MAGKLKERVVEVVHHKLPYEVRVVVGGKVVETYHEPSKFRAQAKQAELA